MFDIEIITAHGWNTVGRKLTAIEGSLADMHDALEAATEIVYEHERQLFDSWGDGHWPPLAESTIQRKAAQGYGEPQRPLYAMGNLFESVTSPHGPYSTREITDHQAVIGVDWDNNGYQIPVLHQEGTATMPARPIFTLDDQLVHSIASVVKARVFIPSVLA